MKDLLNKETVKSVQKYLENIGLNEKIILLNKTARTAKDAANSLNVEVGAIVKSLIFKSQTNNFYLCLVSGDKYVSLKKLSNITNENIIKAEADEIKKITNFSIGGIPPFGHKTPIKTYIDESLSRFKKIYAAAGHTHCVFGISFEEICKVTKGYKIDITE